MVRCSKCKKCFKSSSGEWWDENTCWKCWNKGPRNLEYIAPKIITKLFTSPVDFYLDLYTINEMKKLDN